MTTLVYISVGKATCCYKDLSDQKGNTMSLGSTKAWKALPTRILLAASMVLTLSAAIVQAEEMMHQMPQPTAEHQWLQQFVGEWESDTEAFMEPGKPAMHMKGTESVRPLGGFWTITEVKSTMMEMPFTGNMTLGYDADKKKYIGTWVDSMTGMLWNYEGALDASGKALTLEAEGYCPMRPGKLTKFREVLEMQDKNHKTYKSYMMDDDGTWVNMMTSRATRKQ
jgi:hypothetical protein